MSEEASFKNILKTTYKVNDFISWQRSGALDLSPNFQRRPVWPVGAKSYFVDTVVRGFPVPLIILRERTDAATLETIREVVDGQQRLRTLISFVSGHLLPDYEPEHDDFVVRKTHNRGLAGRKFSTLNAEEKSRILDYQFSVHVLPSSTEDREVLQIFARLNATGTKLNAQELRNASYYGLFKSQMYDLALEQLDRWRSWSIFKEADIARMLEVEEVTDLVITLLEGLHGKTKAKLDGYYRLFDEEFPQSEECAKRFRAVMDQIDEVAGDVLPTTVFRGRGLFNTLFCRFYDLMYGLGSGLKKTSAKRVEKSLKAKLQIASERIRRREVNPVLLEVLRGASTDLKARRERLKFLKEL